MKIKAPYDRVPVMLRLPSLLSIMQPMEEFWPLVLVNMLFTFVFWEGNYQLVGWVRERFPLMQQTRRRIFTQIGLSIGYTILGGTAVTSLLHLVGWAPYEWDYHLHILLMGLFITSVIAIVYETIFYFDLWKSSLLESTLKKNSCTLVAI